MDEQFIRAFLTVMLNDQAYLYASMQALEHKVEKGYEIDQDVFERLQDDFKDEAAQIVSRLYEAYSLEEALEDMDTNFLDDDGYEYDEVMFDAETDDSS